MKTTVIIPTYNERENIQELVPLILAVSSDIQIFIIDDNSPDGTSDIVYKMWEIGSRIFLIKRTRKFGYAYAVKAGVQFSLTLKPDLIIQMASNLSHAPKHIYTYIYVNPPRKMATNRWATTLTALKGGYSYAVLPLGYALCRINGTWHQPIRYPIWKPGPLY